MHDFFLLKKKKTESLTLRIDGVGGLGRPGVDGVSGGRRLSWVGERKMRERESERELKRDIGRAREILREREREEMHTVR
jgi:hypothetical protein